MDVISHGLWGSVLFGRNNKKNFLTAFLFGIGPDVFAFAPLFIGALFGFLGVPQFTSGPPDAALVPSFVYRLYTISHSLIIFALVFLVVWFIRRKPLWLMLPWPLHIFFDIPLHDIHFFPTPFLWPISGVRIDGVSWAHPWIVIPNISILIILYAWFFFSRYRRKSKAPSDF